MSIRNKLLLAITVVLAFVTLLGAVYFRSLATISNRLRLVESIEDLGANVSEMRRAEKNYLIYHDQTSRQDLERTVELTRQEIEGKASELIALEGRAYYGELIKNFSAYSDLARRLVSASGPSVSADRIREQGHLVYKLSRGFVHAERERIDEKIRGAHRTLALSLFVVVGLALAGVAFIARDIVVPLTRIERATREVSEGKYRPIGGLQRQGEVGNLARAFNHMVQRIEEHQEELVQAGKLASLGTLTSGVAHEINNPLNNVSMIAQTYIQLYHSLSDKERLDFMSQIVAQCDRAKEIVYNLLDFSRMRRRNYAFGDLGQVVRRSLKLVQNQALMNNIECELIAAARLPAVYMNAAAIEQVLVNVLTNAIKAMPQGGALRVEVSLSADSHCVEVAVSDTGVGIAPEVLSRIFDPFFTTSGAGRGTGLGLSVSYSIVKSHGGTISVKSEPGTGSTFTVTLPIEGKESSDGEEKHIGG